MARSHRTHARDRGHVRHGKRDGRHCSIWSAGRSEVERLLLVISTFARITRRSLWIRSAAGTRARTRESLLGSSMERPNFLACAVSESGRWSTPHVRRATRNEDSLQQPACWTWYRSIGAIIFAMTWIDPLWVMTYYRTGWVETTWQTELLPNEGTDGSPNGKNLSSFYSIGHCTKKLASPVQNFHLLSR
jgi:hypothetical protein